MVLQNAFGFFFMLHAMAYDYVFYVMLEVSTKFTCKIRVNLNWVRR